MSNDLGKEVLSIAYLVKNEWIICEKYGRISSQWIVMIKIEGIKMDIADFIVGALAIFLLHSLVRYTLQKDRDSRSLF